jgi:hypothetical protein
MHYTVRITIEAGTPVEEIEAPHLTFESETVEDAGMSIQEMGRRLVGWDAQMNATLDDVMAEVAASMEADYPRRTWEEEDDVLL